MSIEAARNRVTLARDDLACGRLDLVDSALRIVEQDIAGLTDDEAAALRAEVDALRADLEAARQRDAAAEPTEAEQRSISAARGKIRAARSRLADQQLLDIDVVVAAAANYLEAVRPEHRATVDAELAALRDEISGAREREAAAVTAPVIARAETPSEGPTDAEQRGISAARGKLRAARARLVDQQLLDLDDVVAAAANYLEPVRPEHRAPLDAELAALRDEISAARQREAAAPTAPASPRVATPSTGPTDAEQRGIAAARGKIRAARARLADQQLLDLDEVVAAAASYLEPVRPEHRGALDAEIAALRDEISAARQREAAAVNSPVVARVETPSAGPTDVEQRGITAARGKIRAARSRIAEQQLIEIDIVVAAAVAYLEPVRPEHRATLDAEIAALREEIEAARQREAAAPTAPVVARVETPSAGPTDAEQRGIAAARGKIRAARSRVAEQQLIEIDSVVAAAVAYLEPVRPEYRGPLDAELAALRDEIEAARQREASAVKAPVIALVETPSAGPTDVEQRAIAAARGKIRAARARLADQQLIDIDTVVAAAASYLEPVRPDYRAAVDAEIAALRDEIAAARQREATAISTPVVARVETPTVGATDAEQRAIAAARGKIRAARTRVAEQQLLDIDTVVAAAASYLEPVRPEYREEVDAQLADLRMEIDAARQREAAAISTPVVTRVETPVAGPTDAEQRAIAAARGKIRAARTRVEEQQLLDIDTVVAAAVGYLEPVRPEYREEVDAQLADLRTEIEAARQREAAAAPTARVAPAKVERTGPTDVEERGISAARGKIRAAYSRLADEQLLGIGDVVAAAESYLVPVRPEYRGIVDLELEGLRDEIDAARREAAEREAARPTAPVTRTTTEAAGPNDVEQRGIAAARAKIRAARARVAEQQLLGIGDVVSAAESYLVPVRPEYRADVDAEIAELRTEIDAARQREAAATKAHAAPATPTMTATAGPSDAEQRGIAASRAKIRAARTRLAEQQLLGIGDVVAAAEGYLVPVRPEYRADVDAEIAELRTEIDAARQREAAASSAPATAATPTATESAGPSEAEQRGLAAARAKIRAARTRLAEQQLLGIGDVVVAAEGYLVPIRPEYRADLDAEIAELRQEIDAARQREAAASSAPTTAAAPTTTDSAAPSEAEQRGLAAARAKIRAARVRLADQLLLDIDDVVSAAAAYLVPVRPEHRAELDAEIAALRGEIEAARQREAATPTAPVTTRAETPSVGTSDAEQRSLAAARGKIRAARVRITEQHLVDIDDVVTAAVAYLEPVRPEHRKELDADIAVLRGEIEAARQREAAASSAPAAAVAPTTTESAGPSDAEQRSIAAARGKIRAARVRIADQHLVDIDDVVAAAIAYLEPVRPEHRTAVDAEIATLRDEISAARQREAEVPAIPVAPVAPTPTETAGPSDAEQRSIAAARGKIRAARVRIADHHLVDIDNVVAAATGYLAQVRPEHRAAVDAEIAALRGEIEAALQRAAAAPRVGPTEIEQRDIAAARDKIHAARARIAEQQLVDIDDVVAAATGYLAQVRPEHRMPVDAEIAVLRGEIEAARQRPATAALTGPNDAEQRAIAAARDNIRAARARIAEQQRVDIDDVVAAATGYLAQVRPEHRMAVDAEIAALRSELDAARHREATAPVAGPTEAEQRAIAAARDNVRAARARIAEQQLGELDDVVVAATAWLEPVRPEHRAEVDAEIAALRGEIEAARQREATAALAGPTDAEQRAIATARDRIGSARQRIAEQQLVELDDVVAAATAYLEPVRPAYRAEVDDELAALRGEIEAARQHQATAPNLPVAPATTESPGPTDAEPAPAPSTAPMQATPPAEQPVANEELTPTKDERGAIAAARSMIRLARRKLADRQLPGMDEVFAAAVSHLDRLRPGLRALLDAELGEARAEIIAVPGGAAALGPAILNLRLTAAPVRPRTDEG